MTDQSKVRFLPFHAINEFMRDDYRLSVVRSVLLTLPDLPDQYRKPVESLTKKMVKVPGFRHSDKAPARVRVLPTADAFEKSPDLVAAILSAWAEMHPDLRQKVYDLLKSRNWEIFPLEVDRAKLPGFGIKWPKGEDFETLVKAFQDLYPGEGVASDDISLMIVWVGGRLPYPTVEDEEDDNGNSEDPSQDE
jgi:hypothetical protein